MKNENIKLLFIILFIRNRYMYRYFKKMKIEQFCFKDLRLKYNVNVDMYFYLKYDI